MVVMCRAKRRSLPKLTFTEFGRRVCGDRKTEGFAPLSTSADGLLYHLTEAKCKAAKPKQTIYYLNDSDGLRYPEV